MELAITEPTEETTESTTRELKHIPPVKSLSYILFGVCHKISNEITLCLCFNAFQLSRDCCSEKHGYNMGLDKRKPDMLDVNNKGADQSAHIHSLISAFVIMHQESTIV